MLLRCDKTRVRNQFYTAAFFMVPGSFERPDSHFPHDPDTIQNGSASN